MIKFFSFLNYKIEFFEQILLSWERYCVVIFVILLVMLLLLVGTHGGPIACIVGLDCWEPRFFSGKIMRCFESGRCFNQVAKFLFFFHIFLHPVHNSHWPSTVDILWRTHWMPFFRSTAEAQYQFTLHFYSFPTAVMWDKCSEFLSRNTNFTRRIFRFSQGAGPGLYDFRFHFDFIITTRVPVRLFTPPPPSRAKTKMLFINLRFNYVLIFIVGIEFFFMPFEPRLEERKTQLLKETSTWPYSIINFPSTQNCHSLHAFSQFWEQERIAGG